MTKVKRSVRCLLPIAFLVGLGAHAAPTIDLSQIGPLPSKGRVQDDESNRQVNALISMGPDAVSYLVARVVDDTEVKGHVLDFWPRVRIGDVALAVLCDLFTTPDGVHTVPGLDWDSLLDRRGVDAPAWELLERFVEAHGRKGLQNRVEQVLARYDGRIAWVNAERCFRPMGGTPPNDRVNATVRPVTPLAAASVAPVRPARYAAR